MTKIPKPKDIDLVLYHKGCTDGFTAAWAAYKLLGEENVEYIGCAYGFEPPDVTGRNVAILDFSFRREVFLKLLEQANSLILLDHHETARDIADIPNVILDQTRSGAGIAWDWFHPDTLRSHLVELAEDGDLWHFKHKLTKPFEAGISAEPHSFNIWDAYHNDPTCFEALIEKGEYIIEYLDDEITRQMRKMTYVNAFGYRIGIVNTNTSMSDFGEAIYTKTDADIGMMWIYDMKHQYVKVGLRSLKGSDVDVCQIAEYFGGGGHKNAAGFTMNLKRFIHHFVRYQEIPKGKIYDTNRIN